MMGSGVMLRSSLVAALYHSLANVIDIDLVDFVGLDIFIIIFKYNHQVTLIF